MDGDRSGEVQALVRKVRSVPLSKALLQAICVDHGIPKTGNKADIQKRIINHIEYCAAEQDWGAFDEIRANVDDRAGITSAKTTIPKMPSPPQVRQQSHPMTKSSPYSPAQTAAPNLTYAMPHSYKPSGYTPAEGGLPARPPGQQAPLAYQALANGGAPRPRPNFYYKHSPFYEMRHQIGSTKTLDVMAMHRNSERISLKIQDHPELQICNTDRSMRLMVFCAAGTSPGQDIAFPHQCELRVNGDEVKANLRGLKNKPGSTRPADITDSLRWKPIGYINNIELTYALTQKKFFLSLVVCKMIPVETLVRQISLKIRKEMVIAEITKKASDDDIITTSQNLSLKCPISYMRLQFPCRGTKCNHIQCFDATSYLQLQEQGPQWICPICNNPAPFEQLAVDEYARDILTHTSDSVEQVTIEPDGTWAVPGAKSDKAVPKQQEASFVDDDELVISGYSSNGVANNYTPSQTSLPATYHGTPTSGVSRDTSAAPRSGSKRPAPEIIDLTLSDDDEPPRPAKRVNYGGSTYGYEGPSY